MKKLARFIVKRYKFFIVLFAVLAVLSCVAVPFVVKRLNSEVMTYLPENTDTVKGINFLSEKFGINADVMFGISRVTEKEAASVADKLDSLYYDVFCKGRGFFYAEENESAPGTKAVSTCLWKDCTFMKSYKLISGGFQDPYSYDEIEKLFYDDGGTSDYSDDTYVFMLSLGFSASSDEAFSAIDFIENDIVKNTCGGNAVVYTAGSTKMAKDIFSNTIGEVWAYTAAGFAVVVIVLLLFTKSWIDPVIIILTLGISILLNIGSNIIFRTNSIITFASSSLLQVALSVDYAVFLISAYREERKHTEDVATALEEAIPKAFRSVFASAMTTLGGFAALFFMRFGIGRDMGEVLAKGILTSFLSVLFLQPALMILFKKPLDSAVHRSPELKFRKPVKFAIKYRSFVVAVLIVSIFPVVLYQNDLSLNYFDFVRYEKKEGRVYEMTDVASHQLVIAVPCDFDDEGSIAAQYSYVEKLRSLKKENGDSAVSFVLGINAMIPENAFSDIMKNETLKKVFLGEASALVKDGYALYTVGLNTSDFESDEAFQTCKAVSDVTKSSFDKETFMTGLSEAGRDFAAVTPKDFQRVTVASVIFIVLILLLTFRSFKHAFLLIILIEFGIWINLGIQKLTGNSINFMSYIVISAIQLGATVDYAILITGKYRDFRKRLLPAHAAYRATTSSVTSVLTSSVILAGACFSVKLMSSVLIVSEVTSLIARGAIISAVLAVFILPALPAFFDRPDNGDTLKVPEQSKLSRRKIFGGKNKTDSQKTKTE